MENRKDDVSDRTTMATPKFSPMSEMENRKGVVSDRTTMATPKFSPMSEVLSPFTDSMQLPEGARHTTNINLEGQLVPAIGRSRSRMRKLASLRGLDEEEQLREELQAKRASLVEKKLKCDKRVREIRSIIQQSFNVFCVFQGVIINALFTGSSLQSKLCSLYPIPFSLSLIAYVYFVAEILFELLRIIQAKEDAHRLESGIKRIEDARIHSARPLADELYEVYTAADAEDRITSGMSSDSFERARVLFDGYARLILFLSTAFTAVVLVSCKLLLCR